jgi:5S rRNA maturation endonuclease (ribonuclease M5)
MKVTAKVKGEISDCFAMAENLEKLTCAINVASMTAHDRNGSGVRYTLQHAVTEAYELAVRHPERKKEFEALGVDIRHIARYAKAKLSEKSADRIRTKLMELHETVNRLRANVRFRCHVPYPGADRI